MMSSIYDLAKEARLRKMPPAPKPLEYRCVSCEIAQRRPLIVKMIDHEKAKVDYFDHDLECGYNNYAFIQWDWRKQEWVDTSKKSIKSPPDDNIGILFLSLISALTIALLLMAIASSH